MVIKSNYIILNELEQPKRKYVSTVRQEEVIFLYYIINNNIRGHKLKIKTKNKEQKAHAKLCCSIDH